MKLRTRWNWSGRFQAAMKAPTAPVLTPEIAWSLGSFERLYFLATSGISSSSRKREIAVAEGIVFEDALEAVLRGVVDGGQHAGIDEDADQRRQVVRWR